MVDSETKNQATDWPMYAVAPAQDASDEDKAGYSCSKWYNQREYYWGLYRYWAKAILFLLNKQWLQWSRTQRTWTTERNVPRWRQQPVTNLCYAVFRSALAKLTKQRPAFTCVPASGDADDRNAANLGDALLKYWWRFFKLPTKLQRTIAWLLTTGNAYVLVDWDPEAGEVRPITTSAQGPDGEEIDDVPADEEGEPKLKEDGTPDTEAEPHRMAIGEIDIRLISPLSVRFNADAPSPEEAEEWFVGDIKPTAVAAEMFEMDADELGGSADDELVTTLDMLTAATTGTTGALNLLNGTDNTIAKGKRSLILYYYRKPNDDYPDGRHWVTVDGKMWPQGEVPVPNGFWPPAIPVQDLPVPGQPIAMGLLGQVVPLNEQYNTLNGQILEHNVTMAKGGKWVLAPEDANLPIDSDPAQKLASKGYAAGRPPYQVDIKALPTAVLSERERILNDLMMVSSMDGTSLGQKPEGVSSGRGFLVLQEATDSVLGPLLTSIEGALAEIGRRCLVLAARKYKEERTVKIGGENGVWQFRAFQGADLSDSMDVQVQVGSSFPWSKAARQDTVLSLIQAMPALVTNPDGTVNHQKLTRYLNVGGIEAFEQENDPDQDEIAREHAEFEDPNGTIPQLGFWQDHPTHYAGHAEFLKRDRERFNRWPPDRQQAFIQHILATQDAIGEAMQQLMPQQPGMGGPQGPPQGGPPQGGPPSQPFGLQGPPQQSEIGLMSSDLNAASPRAA